MTFKARQGYGAREPNSLVPLSQPEPRVDAGANFKAIGVGLTALNDGIEEMKENKEHFLRKIETLLLSLFLQYKEF